MENNVNTFERTRLLLGDSFEKLKKASVAVFGLGGVGGAACDALGRSGIGSLLLVDFDTVNETNLNRLTIADGRDLGRPKCLVAKDRILSVNPYAKIELCDDFLDGKTLDALLEGRDIDYCIDAIDCLGPKISVVERLLDGRKKFISSMGAAGRLNPSLVRFGKLSDVRTCGLAARMRSVMRRNKYNPDKVRVVYSEEYPVKPSEPLRESEPLRGRSRGIQPSIMMVPVTFGMFLAYYVIEKLLHR